MKHILTLTALISLSLSSAHAQKPAHASQYMKAAPVSSLPLIFRVNDDISTKTVPEAPVNWGMDVAWNSSDNVKRGTNYIGQDVLNIGRVSFQPSDLVDADGNLSAAQQATLQSRLNNMMISGVRDIILNCDHEVLCNKDNFPNADQNYRNYNGKPEEWYKVIKATVKYCRAKGFNVITVSPFNEPDYTAWKEGTKSHFKEIARLISEDSYFQGIRISAGNTLNCDQALSWYNAVKPYVTEGNTHQLAGSFANYANFWTTVRNDGNHATADELHNTMEAFVGIHYGLQSGVWWGYDGACRGEFCKASHYGKEIGYAENRDKWTAATVYKRDNGRIDAFLGTSERQAYNSSYTIVSTDRPVYYDTYGPVYSYNVDLPGGTGYSTGQTNAERMVQVAYGEDVPPMSIERGSYVIMNRNSKLALGIYNGSKSNGANVVQSTYSSTKPQPFQCWIVSPVSPRVGGDFGYFFLKSERDSTMLIDVKDWSTSAGANMIVWPGGGGALEQWFVEYAGDGDFYIRSRHSGLYLEVKDAKTTNNMNIVQNNFTGLANQRWRFMPTTAALDLTAPMAPTGLTAVRQSSSVKLTWNPSSGFDVAGYMVLRARLLDGASFEWDVIGRMVENTEFIDNSAIVGEQYVYKVKAVDRSRNVSDASELASIILTASDDPTGSFMPALVANYSFDDTIDDASENIFDAVAPVNVTFNTISKMEGSKSAIFNGTSTYLQLPPAAVTHREMTVAIWVSASSTSSAWQRVFDFGNGTDKYMFLTPSNGSEMRFVMKNGGNEQILSAPKLTTGWHHVAVTIGDEDVTLYVDGVAAATTKDITIRPTDICPVLCYVGRSQFAADPLFKGNLDALRIYNYALSAGDIADLYAGNEPSSITAAGNKAQESAVYSLDGKRIATAQKGVNIIDGKKFLKK